MASLFVPIANGRTDGRTGGRTVGRTTEMASAPYYKLPPQFEEEAKNELYHTDMYRTGS